MPGFSPLEALRAVCSIVSACISAVLFWRATDGSMAFARPIRWRMVRVRRAQMAMYTTICLAWIGQAAVAGTVESPWPPTWPAITLTAAVLYTVIAIGLMAIYQYAKWADFERTVGDMPLIPDLDTAGVQTSIEARPILHDISTHMTIVLGHVSLLRNDTLISSAGIERLDAIDAQLDIIITLHDRAQKLIQSVSKEVAGEVG